jgi:hypothetical protein
MKRALLVVAVMASSVLAEEPKTLGTGGCADPGSKVKQDERTAGPPPKGIANPWLAVDTGVPAALPISDPRRYPSASVYPTHLILPCTASSDHCLRDCSWLLRHQFSMSERIFTGYVAHRRPDGAFVTLPNSTFRTIPGLPELGVFEANYTVYRTVPATKALLAPGRLIAVQEASPEDELEALTTWTMGTAGKVDWAAGTVTLKGSKDPYPIAATRVVVLSWKAGDPAVQLPEGLTKDGIVVTADQVWKP